MQRFQRGFFLRHQGGNLDARQSWVMHTAAVEIEEVQRLAPFVGVGGTGLKRKNSGPLAGLQDRLEKCTVRDAIESTRRRLFFGGFPCGDE
jgi:hypothetical protein